MTTNLQVNDQFPDFSLPDQQNEMVALSRFTKSGLFDRYLGFQDGYPLILVFFRGFFCPRDQQQMRQLVEFQHELAVNYARLVAVSADPPLVQAAFRAGLGAQWTFLSYEQRTVIKQINILDETEGEYAYLTGHLALLYRNRDADRNGTGFTEPRQWGRAHRRRCPLGCDLPPARAHRLTRTNNGAGSDDKINPACNKSRPDWTIEHRDAYMR